MFSRLALATGSSKFRLREAYEQGGKVIFLTDFDESSMLLRDFIKRAWSPGSTLKLQGEIWAVKSGDRVNIMTEDGLCLQAHADPLCRAYDVQLHEIGGAVWIALFERLQNPLVFLNRFPEPGMPSKRHRLRFKDGLAVHVVDLLE